MFKTLTALGLIVASSFSVEGRALKGSLAKLSVFGIYRKVDWLRGWLLLAAIYNLTNRFFPVCVETVVQNGRMVLLVLTCAGREST